MGVMNKCKGESMKKRLTALLMVCMMAASLLTGCGSSKTDETKMKVELDPDNPVTLKIWHYYNGTQQATFDQLLEKFNSTVGKEKGIYVEGYGHGSVADLEKVITSSVNEEVGAERYARYFLNLRRYCLCDREERKISGSFKVFYKERTFKICRFLYQRRIFK